MSSSRTTARLCLVVTVLLARFVFAQAHPDAAKPSGDGIGPRLVRNLLNAHERDNALCQLLRLARYEGRGDWEGCRVNHVVVAPQLVGPPVYVVFKEEDWCDYDGPGLPKGHVILFASDGSLVPFYAGANVLDEKSALFQFGPGGRVALGIAIDYRGNVYGLHVVPVAPEQRPVLSVIVGPPGTPYTEKTVTQTLPAVGGCIGPSTMTFRYVGVHHPWTWRAQMKANAAPPTIEIGPASSLAKGKPRASFRWSATEGNYVGPKGSAAQGFLQLPATNAVSEIANFVNEAATQ